MEIIVVENEIKVIEELAVEIENIANAAIAENGFFRVGLSGGSLMKYLCSGLKTITTDWSKWRLFFCDERFVSENDANSTFGGYKYNLIPKTSLNESQFIPINVSMTLDDCAKDYEEKILKEFHINDNTIPKFDLLLLGMGPDGHTCSLFEGHKLLQEKKKLIAPIADSPKPPSQRITMTLPLINNAKYCIFAMCGKSKADMVKRVFGVRENLPATMIDPKNGKLKCIFDKEAAMLIS